MLLLALALGAAALPAKLPPVDQCRSDASFTKFRQSLTHIVAKKDRAGFLALLAPDVLVDFGGGTGRKAFEEEWKFDPAEYGNLWDQLGIMLKMGCARDGGSRIIPSLPMQVEQDFDEEWVVVLPGAKLYREAGIESAKPTTEPWAVATVTSRAGDTLTGVRLRDGREGFIADDRLYEPLGYRMIVEQRGGKWRITAFVAGD
ncbi:MAG TPA: hypothetical protein VF079_11015 [Sphingomicrobium sp.]